MAVIRRQSFSEKTPQKRLCPLNIEQSPQNSVTVTERPCPSSGQSVRAGSAAMLPRLTQHLPDVPCHMK